MKIAVIGAGASGILAALNISDKHEVYLLDGNKEVGKKILVTGNGKCNFWNENINIACYNTDNKDKLEKILEFKGYVYDYLNEKLGIYPKIKNGYYYPYSSSAASIREIFDRAIQNKSNVTFLSGFKVTNIKDKIDHYTLVGDHKSLDVDKVIIATGSYAAPKTGSDGTIFECLSKLGIKINKISPSLVPLIAKNDILKEWNGIRCDVALSLYEDDKLKKCEKGEIQLTDYGISGIVTFNVSSICSKGLSNDKKEEVKINFMPEVKNLDKFITDRAGGKTLEEIFESIFNYKLLFALLKASKLDKNAKWDNLSQEEKNTLIKNIKEFTLKIIDTEGFDRAQVATGGISLDEINSNFKIGSTNIYAIGEALDVDGDCGGYNLAFAFISGYLCGRNIDND